MNDAGRRMIANLREDGDEGIELINGTRINYWRDDDGNWYGYIDGHAFNGTMGARTKEEMVRRVIEAGLRR